MEALGETLRQLEEGLPSVADPARHREMKREAAFIRADIRGRMVAIAVGEGRLGVDTWPGPESGEP